MNVFNCNQSIYFIYCKIITILLNTENRNFVYAK